jgi:outer membrane receptor protein involved in Fe transport
MRSYLRLCAVLAAAIILVCATSLFAQLGASLSQLNGTVTDQSDRSVAKATVTLRGTETNRTYSTATNDSGLYVIPNAQPGRYELTVEAAGFAKTIQTGIELTVGQVATVNVGLKVASVGERVEVTAEVPVIEPTKTEISQVIATQQIGSLPISGRLFTDFALLTPGVATSRTSLGTTFTDFETTQISFAGMRSFSNEITVDGADFVNASSGVQRATPPQESVQEFRVVNNSFGSEYGRAVGGIVNIVTKGGTNDLHGSIYDYLQNNKANSRSLLQPAPLPYALRQNQFGGTLGGPIRKDKTFFFANYEARRRAESPVYPPNLIKYLDLIDAAKAQLGIAPEGCNGGLSACTGSNIGYLNGFMKTGDDDAGFVRLDHAIGEKNRLGVRYTVQDVRSLGELVGQTLDGGGIGTPSGGRNLYVRDQSIFGTLDTTITNNVVNTALVQYARRHYGFLGASGQPDFSILNDLELGHNFGTQDRTAESRVEFSDSVSWVRGNHVLKFGFDGNVIRSLFNFPGFTPVRALIPTGNVTSADCLAAFAEFHKYGPNWPNTAAAGQLLTSANNCPVVSDNGIVFAYAGVPLPTDPNFTVGSSVVDGVKLKLDNTNWSTAYPPSLSPGYDRIINHGYWGLFLQDQWRVTRKLTVNAGLRWDYESGLADYVNPDYRGFQPRVGFAYSPDSKTVIRAGFGMFDDRYNMTFFYVPNTQKVAPGYLCGNHASSATASNCSSPGPLPPVPPFSLDPAPKPVRSQNLPMILNNLGQASQGYQLFAFPAAAGASAYVDSIITNGDYVHFQAINPVVMAGTCGTTLACGVGSGGMDHNMSKIPYAEQASFEVERQFGGGFAVNLGYLFVSAHRLVRGNNINVPCPVGTTDTAQAANPTDPNVWPFAPPGGPFPGFPDWVPGKLNADGSFSSCSSGTPTLGSGALAGLGPWFGGAGPFSGLQTMSAGLLDYNNGVANANYHGGTLTVMERGKYLNLTGNYTYSHTIDNGNFTTFINLPVNQFDYKHERANSNQDGRHRFVVNFSATAPDNSFARHFAFSSIVTAQSGRPFTIFYGANALNDVAGGATDRVGGAPLVAKCPSPDDCSSMIPRNTYVGDPLYSWDFRLSRTIQVREKIRLELSVDAFNALNRKNVDEVTTVYGSPVFCGAIPQRYNDAVSQAINQGAASVACPVSTNGLVIPGVLSFARTPITDLNPLATCNGPAPDSTCKLIPAKPNQAFGLPRTMLNPRQFQFGLKFSF